METHPFFTNILMHSDAELAGVLGVKIAERETIHAWPLSSVQRLRLDDGTRLIYKSQLPPTVEPEFYERASSNLLPGYRLLDRLGECAIMAIDWIEAPLLRDEARDEAELIDHGRQVIAQIAEIGGDLPVVRDIGSAGAWLTLVEGALEKLGTLVLDGRFGSTEFAAVDKVRRWAMSSETVEAVTRRPRVIHGDLKADQVFVARDGYRVIDWQRPVLGPPEVDLVSLLVGERIDPRRHVDAMVVRVYWFLHLDWAVEAQFDLFPEFRGSLFDQWSSEAIAQILHASE